MDFGVKPDSGFLQDPMHSATLDLVDEHIDVAELDALKFICRQVLQRLLLRA